MTLVWAVNSPDPAPRHLTIDVIRPIRRVMRTPVLALALILLSSSAGAAEWLRPDGTPAVEGSVTSTLAEAQFVLLGETHDNPAHHETQAALLRALVAAERRPAVVLEMVERDRQGAIDRWAEGPDADDPDAFARAVGWAESGWPDFSLYRPVIAAAVAARLAIVAGGLERGVVLDVAERGLSGLAPDRLLDWGLAEPLPASLLDAQRDAVFEGHCRLVPRDALGPMVDVQVARDASMAVAMVRHPEGVVLIAGRGHVRSDVGVPFYLKRLAPAGDIVTVGLLEREDDTDPFDWRLVQAKERHEDPCTALKERFGKSG